MTWLALALAVFFNVLANVSFKLAMSHGRSQAESAIWTALSNPWLWVGGVSCVLLLASYLYALRGVGLGTAYAVVTSLALVFVSASSAVLFQEQFTLVKAIGVLSVVVGIFLIVNSELA